MAEYESKRVPFMGRELKEAHLHLQKASSLDEITQFLEIMVDTMEKNDQSPETISRAFETVSAQFGIRLPDDFVKADPVQ